MARMGTLKDGQTKNGGISDNNDNARGTHRLVQGDLDGMVRAKRSQLLSSSHESGLHLLSLRSSQIFCSFWQFRVQTVATAVNATGGVQITPLRTHACARFLTAHARTPDVITRLAQGLSMCLCVSNVISSLVMSLLNVPCLKHVLEGLNMCPCDFWLRPNQDTMNRIKARGGTLITPYYRATFQARGRKHRHSQWQKDHAKAVDAKRGAKKRGSHPSILSRWYNDVIFPSFSGGYRVD